MVSLYTYCDMCYLIDIPRTRIESPVLVSQISRERVNLSNETVSILFTIETVCFYEFTDMHCCVYN